MRNPRFAMLAAALGIVASLPGQVLGSAGSSFGPAVRGKLIWDSSSKGTFNAGRNAAKRARREQQKQLRAKWRRLRDYGDPSMKSARFPKIKNLPAMSLKNAA